MDHNWEIYIFRAYACCSGLFFHHWFSSLYQSFFSLINFSVSHSAHGQSTLSFWQLGLSGFQGDCSIRISCQNYGKIISNRRFNGLHMSLLSTRVDFFEFVDTIEIVRHDEAHQYYCRTPKVTKWLLIGSMLSYGWRVFSSHAGGGFNSNQSTCFDH